MRKLFLAVAVAVAIALTATALAQPAPITRRVVGASQLKDATEVIINAGSDDGVGKTWKAFLVDDKGNPVPDGELTMVRIDKKTTTARSSIPMKETMRLKVRLEP